jgi:type IV secretion system protein VirD4
VSSPFQKFISSRARRETGAPIDPQGQRLIGLTVEGREPIWAPKGHSLLLAAAGGGKTTSGAMPWLYSYVANEPGVATLVLDSKNGELALQSATMLADLGQKVSIIDECFVLPADCRHRIALNPFDAAVSVFDTASEDLIFALDSITNALIEEPADGDSKNKYFRAWPRLMIEFAIMVMLSRNPRLCIPGGIAALLGDSDMLKKFAAIETEEGDASLKGLANSILGMVGHEHWFQHLEAAQSALRQFRPGTRLHAAGRGATLGHADLIREGAHIFLVGPQQHMNQLGPYYALHLMSFLQAAYSGAGRIRIIADEFTNAPLKSLVEALTTLRGFGVEVAMIAQSRSEIERRFGRLGTLTIEENAIVKQWFGFSSFDEAARVSKAMGEELTVGSSLGADSESLRLNTNMNLVRQRWMSPAELMAMPADQQLVHIKGLGFFVARKIGQQQIAPFCHLVAENPIEGGRLAPDPIITLTTPSRRPA